MPERAWKKTSLAGNRAPILWHKAKLLGISGGGYDSDSYEAICPGSAFPLRLNELVHVFNWTTMGKQFQTIPLRADKGFALRAYIQSWLTPLWFLSLIAAVAFACVVMVRMAENKPWWLFAALAVLFLGITVAFVPTYLSDRRRDRRDQDIRLLLGRHEWGSSDPACWHEDLLGGLVNPREAFKVESFVD